MKNKKAKYLVVISYANGNNTQFIESNSRNARKHLVENNADRVSVYPNIEIAQGRSLLCMAVRMNGCIVFGTSYK